ncbi:hypothetical protein WA026_021608 [Henosepilachna vigintioctopunctata]|uniref:C2H2-type domain-containing protein n=1 Tax=Henosepilachna vigintioctopunctata TaxID=420089 RepID=A0AAW1V550_9CUCU
MDLLKKSLSEFLKFETAVEIVHQIGQLPDLEEEVLLENGEFYTVEKTDYTCQICEKAFSQKGNLMRHLRMHEGVKPFTCELCGHKFAQKANLKKHLDAHSQKKDFLCNLCHKAFVQKANLLQHSKIHSGKNFELILNIYNV